MAGHAFQDPEKGGVDFLLVVEGAELFRTDPLSVPDVEILVRQEGEKTVVGFLLPEGEIGELKGARVPVFQPSAKVGEGVEQEGVVTVGHVAHHFRSRFDDLLRVAHDARFVVISPAVDHDAVPFPARPEGGFPESSDLHRGVHQRVVVGGDVPVFRFFFQAGRHAPTPGGDDPDGEREFLRSVEMEKNGSPVQVPVFFVEMAGANGQVVRPYAVPDPELPFPPGTDAPAALVDFFPSPTARGEFLQVPGVIADLVGAGHPGGQNQVDGIG